MERDARVWVAGPETLIGAALCRVLAREPVRLVGGPGAEPPLTDGDAVDAFVRAERPAYVFVAGGKSGGIRANDDSPADFMLDNLLVATHVLASAHRHGVRKLLYLGSSCVYPKACAQPMQVESLMTGPVEPTSESYAVAKIAGLTLCRAFQRQYGARFVGAIPGDAYGPGDDFGAETAHVVPALIRRMHEAKRTGALTVTVWGTGTPRRELIFADDLAGACITAMRGFEGPGPINLGSGSETTIAELAEAIREIVGYPGAITLDTSRPDGAPRKQLDSSELRRLGWTPGTSLRAGLAATYESFLANVGRLDPALAVAR